MGEFGVNRCFGEYGTLTSLGVRALEYFWVEGPWVVILGVSGQGLGLEGLDVLCLGI